jgi:hypothetical protein
LYAERRTLPAFISNSLYVTAEQSEFILRRFTRYKDIAEA